MIIDVCRAYWQDGSPLDLSHNPEAVASPGSMSRLLEAARKGQTPVVWTQVHYNHPSMKDAGVFGQKISSITAWQEGDTRGLNAALPGLEPSPDDVVVQKRMPSAFFETTLNTELRLLDIDTLVLCGVSTSGCVRATALDAICNGFRVLVWQNCYPS